MNSRLFDEIPQGMFSNFQQIGSGSFSDIFVAIHVATNTKVALKIMLKNDDQEEMKSIEQEITINKILNHPFICKFFTEIETEHLWIIVMELIEGINSLNYVNQTSGLPISEAQNLFAQLIVAMEYLHNEAHITHRDLKLENIMIDKYNHIRLIDFGFSSVNTMMSTCCGSIPYCAPEILLEQKYTKAADIWSMGVILYAFIDGNLPFYHSNINALATMICNREVTFSDNFDDDIKDLLRKMLSKNPEHRITINEIKSHPFVSNEKLLKIDYKSLFSSNHSNFEQPISLAANRSSQVYNSIFYGHYLTGSTSNFAQNNSKLQKISSIPKAAKQATQSNNNFNYNCNINQSNGNDLNETISSRKDFPTNLNKAIQKALLEFDDLNLAPQQRNRQDLLHLKLNRAFSSKRHTHHPMFKHVAPLVHPNVNQNSIVNHVFEKK